MVIIRIWALRNIILSKKMLDLLRGNDLHDLLTS